MQPHSIWYPLCSVYSILLSSEVTLIYWLLWCFITILLDILATLKEAQNEKDLEIVMLRQQVRILQREYQVQDREPNLL